MTRLLAGLDRKIISLGLAIRPISQLITRGVYAVLETRSVWCDYLLYMQKHKLSSKFETVVLLNIKACPHCNLNVGSTQVARVRTELSFDESESNPG